LTQVWWLYVMCCLANTTASCNVYYYAHDIYYIYLKVLLGRSLSLSLIRTHPQFQRQKYSNDTYRDWKYTEMNTCRISTIFARYIAPNSSSGSLWYNTSNEKQWTKNNRDKQSASRLLRPAFVLHTMEQFKCSLKGWLFECAYGRRVW